MIMILPLQTGQNNPILRRKAREVKEITPEIKRLILDMKETMEKAEGLGLAGPQIGCSVRVIIAKPDDKTIVLINPKIKNFSRKKVIAEEGCLSLPNQFYLIERPAEIKVEGLDQRAKKIKIKADGLLARIIQHEIDHLDGVLIIDRIDDKKT